MASGGLACLKNFTQNKQKKYALGCDVDKEEIFNYPYLTDDETIKFIKEHGRIMFIIRGPNSTLKATLSEMITTQYLTAQHCCANHYFSKTFSPASRNKETLTLSHEYCEKKVLTACLKNESPIIVQNTHIRKLELQKYLDFAARFNYTVIMAVTLYKFKVTPRDLERNNPDGLNAYYFKRRLDKWDDIPPLFTGWFLSPANAAFVLKSLQTTLSELLNDAKFCRVFNSYDDDAIWSYFDGRRNLYCVAGYTYNTYVMKKYYLSDQVQECYGKSYSLTILGYLITKTEVMGIVDIDEEMSHLLFKTETEDSISEQLSLLNVSDNIHKYKSVIPLCQNDASESSVTFEDWQNEAPDLSNCKLIHVAQKKEESFDIRVIKNTNLKTLSSLTDDMQYSQLNDIQVCRLPDDEWLVKLPKKLKVKTVFTGLYI